MDRTGTAGEAGGEGHSSSPAPGEDLVHMPMGNLHLGVGCPTQSAVAQAGLPDAQQEGPSMAEPECSVSFLQLPAEVLEAALLPLELRERVRATTCCWRLQDLSRASMLLWASIRLRLFTLREAESFAVWLARRQLLVGKLWARGPMHAVVQRQLGSTGQPECPEASAQQGRLAAADEAILLAAASSPRLTALLREAACPMDLAGPTYLLAWPHLQWLVLSSPRLSLPCLSSLTALTTLRLTASEVSPYPPSKGLPSGLLELSLSTADSPGAHSLLRAAVSSATKLTRLELDLGRDTGAGAAAGGESAGFDASWLSSLLELKALALTCCDLGALPTQLAALSQLEALDLSGNHRLGRQEGQQSLAQLSQLGRLREVALCSCGLATAPAAVMELPGLQALHLMGNPALFDEAALWGDRSTLRGRALATLQEVGLDIRAAASALNSLRSMTHLSRLHLKLEVSFRSGFGPSAEFMARLERGAVLGIARLPRLARLIYDDAEARSAESFGSLLPKWLEELRWECAVGGVEVERVEGPRLPGLQDRTPWDAAKLEL